MTQLGATDYDDPSAVIPVILRGPKRTPLIFLDTETTGLRPDRHKPWEVAWITALHSPGVLEICDSAVHFVTQTIEDRRQSDCAALDIGRWGLRYPHGGGHVSPVRAMIELATACVRISALAGDEDKMPHLVGAVPSFDHAMLCANWLDWPGYGEGLWHYHLIDVEVLAAGHLQIPPPYSSDELCERYGVVVDEAEKHTALGDAKWAARLYAAVYGLEITGNISPFVPEREETPK